MSEKLPSQPSPQPNLEPLSRTQVLIAIGFTAVGLLLLSRLWLLVDRSAELLKVEWSSEAAVQGLGLGVAITIASNLAYRIWGAYRQNADHYLTLILKPLVLPDLIWLGLLPGMSEELLFRGVMLPAIGLNGFGLLISSLCFGVLHYSGSNQWAYVIWAAAIGAVLGGSAIVTGNLLVPIVAHVFTNLISSCLWKLRHSNSSKSLL